MEVFIINLYKNFKFLDDKPKYIQICDYIKKLIDDKTIKDGDKLPTIREFAKNLSVNNVTIINAYNKLKEDGYAYQKMGSGSYAKRKEITTTFRKEYSKILRNINHSNLSEIIDFTGETTGEVLFPIDDLKYMINLVLDRDGAKALVSDSRNGYSDLIYTINDVFWNNNLNSDDIVVVSGAQQGIDIAAKSILNINDNVIVEKPTYAGALSVFKWRRVNVFEVPIEKDGIDLKQFEKILKKNDIRCFYTMSYFQNPTGISYSTEKKKRILELAEIYDFYIIEDDYLSELIYESSLDYIPFKKLDKNNRVIYIKSFSKIFLPGIRIGYLVAPAVFREVIQNSKHNTDITTSSLMQRSLDLYIKSEKWKNNINKLNDEYSKRYNLMKNILINDFKELVNFTDPKGGLNFYLTLKDKNINTKILFRNLIKKNVYITPGEILFTKIESGQNALRLSFYQTNEDKIIQGMDILKKEILSYNSGGIY